MRSIHYLKYCTVRRRSIFLIALSNNLKFAYRSLYMPRNLIKNVEKILSTSTSVKLIKSSATLTINSWKLKKKNVENSIRRSMESIEGPSFSQRILTTSFSQRFFFSQRITTTSFSQRLFPNVFLISFLQRFLYILVLTK